MRVFQSIVCLRSRRLAHKALPVFFLPAVLVTLALSASPALALSGRLAINNGAAYTRSRTVTAYSYVSGATKMSFSTGGSYSAWTAFRRTKTLTLSAGDATKVVRARYMSATRRIIYLSDAIVLDTTPPTGSITANDGVSYSIVPTVTVEPFATGASQMRFRADDATWTAWSTYSRARRTFIFSTDGTHTVWAGYRDAAGNSVEASDSVRVVLARTPLSGSITEDTTLSPGVYVLDGTVTVERGARLAARPSVCLLSNYSAGLTIEGSLEMSGTRTDPTMMTTDPGHTGGGILFSAGSSGSLLGVTISRQNEAVTVENDGGPAIRISGCDLSHNRIGVHVNFQTDSSAPPLLTSNAITDNTSYGLYYEQFRDIRNTTNTQTYLRNGQGNCIVFCGMRPLDEDLALFDPIGPSKIAYLVTWGGEIVGGHTLTLGPGVVIKNWSMRLGLPGEGSGRLVSNGGPERPVVLTSAYDDSIGGHNADQYHAPAPEDWRGVSVEGSSSAVLRHTIIRYANYAVDISNDEGARVQITDCELSRNVRGVHTDLEPNPATAPIICRNTIVDNTEYGLYYDHIVNIRGTTNTQTYLRNGYGNCIDILDAHDLHEDITLFDPIGPSKVAYVIEQPLGPIMGGHTLTLGPGVVLKPWDLFVGGAASGGAGRLLANGEPGRPVVITSIYDDSIGGRNIPDSHWRDPQPGDWAGITVSDTSTVALRHTIVRYAQDGVYIPHGQPAVRIIDSELSRNEYGMFVHQGGSGDPIPIPYLLRNRIVDNSLLGLYYQQLQSFKGTTNTQTYERNGHGNCIMFFMANNLTEDVTLFAPLGKQKIAYVLDWGSSNVGGGATLTLEPGCVLKRNFGFFTFGMGGAPGPGYLISRGEPGNPVVITSIHDSSIGGQNDVDSPRDPAPSDWPGIWLSGESSATLRYTTIRYADEAAIVYSPACLELGRGTIVEDCRVGLDSGGHDYSVARPSVLQCKGSVVRRCQTGILASAGVLVGTVMMDGCLVKDCDKGLVATDYCHFYGPIMAGPPLIQYSRFEGNVLDIEGPSEDCYYACHYDTWPWHAHRPDSVSVQAQTSLKSTTSGHVR